jgi:hypothetical protein
MKNIILTALCFFTITSVLSQEKTITLKGKITAPQLEGAFVHIINITQQTGTVNNSQEVLK